MVGDDIRFNGCKVCTMEGMIAKKTCGSGGVSPAGSGFSYKKSAAF